MLLMCCFGVPGLALVRLSSKVAHGCGCVLLTLPATSGTRHQATEGPTRPTLCAKTSSPSSCSTASSRRIWRPLRVSDTWPLRRARQPCATCAHHTFICQTLTYFACSVRFLKAPVVLRAPLSAVPLTSSTPPPPTLAALVPRSSRPRPAAAPSHRRTLCP